MKPITITKSHQLVTAHLGFTAKETDIFHLLLTSLKKESNAQKKANEIKNTPRCADNDGVYVDELTLTYEYTRADLLECLNVPPNHLMTYIDDATDKIMEKVATIRNVKTGEWWKNTLVNKAKYEKGVLTLQLNKDVAELLLNYTKGFAIIDFDLMFSLRTTNEKRILDLISRFKNDQHFFRVRIGELCEILGVDFKKYASFNSFRSSVLTNPLKKIVKNSKGMWVFRADCKTGIRTYSSGRTTDENSFVEFRLDYVEITEKEITEKESEALKNAADLSEVVANWRVGIAPTGMQAAQIKQSNLMEEDVFIKLVTAFPPTW